MARIVLMLSVLYGVFFFVLGCSGGDTPLAPINDTPGNTRTTEGGNTLFLGLWQVTIDLNNATIDSVPIRQGDLILNVLGFMEPPPLSKLNIDWTNLHIGDGIIDQTILVDVIFTHPIPDPVFTGFDVRGVVFGPNLNNADGWTIIPSPEFFKGIPFGYQDGLLGAPDSYAHYTGVAGYKYFCDGLGKDDDLPTFFSDPANLANRGQYSAGAVHTRHYELDWEDSGQNFFVFNYAVYANYDWPEDNPPIELEDFPITTANSAEAFCAKITETANSLYYTTTGGGAISLDVMIWDWQENISSVTLESIDPGILGPVDAVYFGPGSEPFESIWTFANIPGSPTTVGDLDLLITVTDPVTFGEAWFFEFLPTTHSKYYEPLYNCWIHTATVSACPPPIVASMLPNDFKPTWTYDDVQIGGSMFIDGPSLAVKLAKTGQSDIVGTDVKYVSDTQVTCDFTIPAINAPGPWNVVVTNGCGTPGTGTGLATLRPPCITEPVDIEAAPYNGTWTDGFDTWESSPCASEVVNTNGTNAKWYYDEALTNWRIGTGIAPGYDTGMLCWVVGPKIKGPSVGGLRFTMSLASATIQTGDRISVGFQVNGGPLTDGLGYTATATPASYSGLNVTINMAGFVPTDEISWCLRFFSHATNPITAGTGVHISQVLVESYDPGKVPIISDGGVPNPANEICTTGTLVTWFTQGSYRFNYFNIASVFGTGGFKWAGGDLPPYGYMAYGPWGFIHPAYTITIWGHKNCDRRPIDCIYPFMDWISTCDCLSATDPNHAAMLPECAGQVRWQRKDSGLPTDRVILQWCDVGQMEEGGSKCNFRVVFNQNPNNANPNDMRFEWVTTGTHAKETVPTNFTGSFIIWKGVFMPIRCDNKWVNGTSVVIDQP